MQFTSQNVRLKKNLKLDRGKQQSDVSFPDFVRLYIWRYVCTLELLDAFKGLACYIFIWPIGWNPHARRKSGIDGMSFSRWMILFFRSITWMISEIKRTTLSVAVKSHEEGSFLKAVFFKWWEKLRKSNLSDFLFSHPVVWLEHVEVKRNAKKG